MRLERGESVVTAWAESAHGSGWSNRLIWVLISSAGGNLRMGALQPDEQSPLLLALHPAAASMALALLAEAKQLITEKEATK